MEFKRCMGCMSEYEGDAPCPYCGFDAGTYEAAFYQLMPGTVLNGKYVLGKILGEGGFGISYVGWDLNLEHKVAIKEYYPMHLVTRQTKISPTITVLTGTSLEFYQKGLGKFVDEARTLAKFSGLPGIVLVRDYFQENGTAYIIMEFAEGDTLKTVLERAGGCLPVESVLRIMRPVIESLGEIHKKGLIHRDISPDNLMVDLKGRVKLLDFGAARNYISEKEKSLSIILKPGYAPEEQYRSRGEQGPWTDIYALCATIYRAVTGVLPPESLDRVNGEKLKLPSSLGVMISRQQEKALMKGLELYKKNRFATMEELKCALYQTEPSREQGSDPTTDSSPGSAPIPEPNPSSTPNSVPDPHPKKVFKEKRFGQVLTTVVIFLLSFLGIMYILGREDTETASSEKDFQVPAKVEWTTENGNRYEGFQNGENLPSGQGKVIYANGDQYEGNFVDGYRQGHGKYTWENGAVYVGNYESGKKSGFGILEFADSDQMYIGEWKDNQREGLGILYDKDEQYETGVWKENKKVENIQGVPLETEDGYLYSSSEEELSNKVIIFYSDGTMYIGEANVSAKKPTGWGVTFSKDDLESCSYIEGMFGYDGSQQGIVQYFSEEVDAYTYVVSEEFNGPFLVIGRNGDRRAGFVRNGEQAENWIETDGNDGSVKVGSVGDNGGIVPDSGQEQWIQGKTMCIGIRENGKIKGEHVVIEKDGLCALRNVEEEFLVQFPSGDSGTGLEYFIWGNTTDSGEEWKDGALCAYMQEDGRTGLKIYKNGKWEQAE